MKRLLKSLVVVFILIVSITFTATSTASAASFTSLADDLKEIGMFRGTAAGYELDRQATRIEVAVMVVRLLGQEENAAAAYEAGTIAHPFTDVPGWAGHHVAYLYTNGLANGASATEFGSSDLCSAQMYCAYLLRALGYSDKDGGDFKYDEALAFAKQTGLADSVLLSDTFTRDSLVAVTYQALATNVKGGDDSLLSKLIKSGAVDAASAENISRKIAIYDKLNETSKNFNDYSSYEGDMTMDMSMSMNDQTITMSDMSTSMKIITTDTSIEAEIIINVQDASTGIDLTISEWMKDGWLYISDGTNKSKMKMDYNEMLRMVRESSLSNDTFPIYYYAELAEDSAGGETNYTLSILPEYLTSAVEALVDQPSFHTQEGNVKYNKVTESFKLDQNGMLKSISMMIDISMSDTETGDVTAVISGDMTIKSIGKTVIKFPDFSDFKETATGLEEA